MKKCFYCNEEIQETAKKCRFCGEWLNKDKNNLEAKPKATNKKLLPFFLSGLFKGRINRKSFGIGFVIFFIAQIISAEIQNSIYYSGNSSSFTRFIGWLTLFAFIFLSISLLVRRLHDINRSGKNLFWFFLGIIIPFLLIWYIIIIFQKGDQTANKYGEVPSEKKSFWATIFNLN